MIHCQEGLEGLSPPHLMASSLGPD